MTDKFQRSRSDGGSFPHRAHSAESRGLSFDSPLELSRPTKRVLSPPGSNASHTAVRNNVAAPVESGSYARKKFRQRSENTMSLSIEQASETDVKDTERDDRKSPYPGPSLSFPSQEEHIAKKKRAMFQVNPPPHTHHFRLVREGQALDQRALRCREAGTGCLCTPISDYVTQQRWKSRGSKQ